MASTYTMNLTGEDIPAAPAYKPTTLGTAYKPTTSALSKYYIAPGSITDKPWSAEPSHAYADQDDADRALAAYSLSERNALAEANARWRTWAIGGGLALVVLALYLLTRRR